MTPAELGGRAQRALEAFLALTATEEDWHRADRAVTLHCLASHAPAFFEAHRLAPLLDEALARLADVPSDFPDELGWEVVMARLDAHYFRALHGLPRAPLPEADVRRAIERVTAESTLAGWLVGELAQALGLEVDVPEPVGLGDAERTSWRTHQVLLWTCYLRDPLEVDASEALDELERTAPMRLVLGQIDSGAEMLFCLQAGGRAVEPGLLEALAQTQRDDGSFREEDDDGPREHAHTTAVCLIALAFDAPG
ncbi:MAG: hypothetical protein SFW67_26430 [Myxococcaceae bacterium]|nr:hypothetical protein [Myxococcaceae bacterium]